MLSKAKSIFKRKASDNNGTIRVNIPNEIAEHLNLKPGQKIGFQTEHSDENGKYASFWNHTEQENSDR